MPKPKSQPAEELLELEDFQDEPTPPSSAGTWRRAPLWARWLGGGLVLAALLVGSFELAYGGKIYPGVSANGVYVGGLTRDAAAAKITEKTSQFTGNPITITAGSTILRIPIATLGVTYDTKKAADLAYGYGRAGKLSFRLGQQIRALTGHAVNFSAYQYDDSRLAPYLVELADDLTTPVKDAALNFDDNRAQVTPARPGDRLDLGRLTLELGDRLAHASLQPIAAPVYQLQPELTTAPVQAVSGQLDTYLAAPITLEYSGTSREISQKTIISWVQVSSRPRRQFMQTLKLDDLYPLPPAANLGLSPTAVTKYIAELATGIDHTAQNAGLTMQDGQLSVSTPSRTGVKLDQAAAVRDVTAALDRPTDNRRVSLHLTTTKAAVNEENLASLGIKELISEGQTFFPGSTAARLTNVRAGAKTFNGVLLSPGEIFSFGTLLGDVGPQTGYVPELVILADHVEKQYGGGLCQVSSTAFRAALLAGLPILERHNHSYAVSYYTLPYGVPGVDATIYYPPVDFKFKNDTGSYILIQTIMQSSSLKFEFYGTKTKSGVIRGPEFISGSNDATKPSHTVFYRDIVDLAGAVTKTDRFDTWYQSSNDFPHTPQLN